MGNIVTQKELVEIIAKAWNALDAAIIEPLLADDFEYQSFWVFETMRGKDNYVEYLTGKFGTIRRTGSKVKAMPVYQEGIDEYVVALDQDGIRDAALQIWTENGLVTKMWMRPLDLVGLK